MESCQLEVFHNPCWSLDAVNGSNSKSSKNVIVSHKLARVDIFRNRLCIFTWLVFRGKQEAIMSTSPLPSTSSASAIGPSHDTDCLFRRGRFVTKSQSHQPLRLVQRAEGGRTRMGSHRPITGPRACRSLQPLARRSTWRPGTGDVARCS